MVLHCLIEKGEKYYSAICLELNVASQGKTLKEAEANIKEAVDLYLECVIEAGDEKEFIPRPAPRELWLRFFEIEEKRMRKAVEKKKNLQFEFENVISTA